MNININENWLHERLQSLAAEHEKGSRRLRELDAERADVARTMTRIDGAIQVLQEMTKTTGEARESSAPRLVSGTK